MAAQILGSTDTILAALEAAGEATRLRLLHLFAEAELTVSELVSILGQSQPRVSRHLKLLLDAGLIERHREGAWAFFRLSERGVSARLAHDILARLNPQDVVLAADRARLADVRKARADQAEAYFASQAANWDELRKLHVPDLEVEHALAQLIGSGPFQAVLDLGTGTGRMLEMLAPFAVRAVGIDQSPAMLAVARVNLEQAGVRNVQLRQGDLYALPVERDGYDLVIVHQVLHYLDDPARAVREAARTLRPQGRLVIVDFAPHEAEFLRKDHAHRRLGFAREEVSGFLRDAGLDFTRHQDLVPVQKLAADAGQLTVSIWVGRDPRVVTDVHVSDREVA